MTPQIKERIKQIKCGDISDGYKKTEFGIFPCDWKIVSLGDVSIKKGEYGLNAPACNYRDDLPKYIRITDIDENGNYVDTGACVNFNDNNEQYTLKKDDIVFARTGASVGRNYLYKSKDGALIFAGFLIRFSLNKNIANPYIVYANCNSKQYWNWVNIVSARSGQPGINAEEYSGYKFCIPKSIEEQEKIAQILTKWDEAIELYNKQIDLLKQNKSICLKKMFPAKGKSVPERRFKGFTDDWKQRKLGDICQVTMGQSPDGSTYSETPSDYILVQGNADLKDGWVSPRIWTTQKTKTAEAGDLIMSVRAPAGAMGKTAYNVVLGRGVAGIKGNEFIYQSLVKMDSDGYWKKLAAGSTFESINSDAVNGAEFVVPQDIVEQNKIGDFLASIDNLITLYQRKIEKTENQRKVLQQYLLNGIVRCKLNERNND